MTVPRVSVFNDEAHPTATTYQLDPNTSDRPVPGVLGLTYVRKPVDRASEKLLQKSSKSTWNVFRFLSGAETADSKATGYFITLDGVKVVCGRDALEERVLPSPNSKSDTVVNYFSSVKTVFKAGWTTNHFLHCRSSNIKETTPSLQTWNEATTHIVIHSGVCLFSAKAVGFVSTQGSPMNGYYQIPPLPNVACPTLYELETITRLSSQIADIIAILQAGPLGTQGVQVRLDIPRLQYYMYPLELYQKGVVDRTYLQGWFGRVDTRHHQITAVFKEAIREGLLQRRVLTDISIEKTSGTDFLCEYIHNAVKSGLTPSFQQIMLALLSLGPNQSTWELFLSYLDETAQPTDIRSLSYLAYVFEVLQPVLTAGKCLDNSVQHSRSIIIQVDDVAEWRIYNSADKLTKKIPSDRRPLLIGIFPFHRILTPEGKGRSSLFLHDPSPPVDHLPGGFEPIQIIGQTYGVEIAEIMGRVLLAKGLDGN